VLSQDRLKLEEWLRRILGVSIRVRPPARSGGDRAARLVESPP